MSEHHDRPTRRALVVRGGWEGHQPVETTELFIPFLERNGFVVRVEESPAVYADAAELAETDLILQNVTMSSIEPAQLTGLIAAVERGTGLAGWHGGIVDSYRDCADYLQFIGAQFAAHPGIDPARRTGDQSDNYVPYRIEMTAAAAAHPITAGLRDFDLVTEQYWLLHDDYLDVLATTTQAVRAWDPWTREITSPAIWTRRWGAGRIFATAAGHRADVLEHPTLHTIIERGLLWAAR